MYDENRVVIYSSIDGNNAVVLLREIIGSMEEINDLSICTYHNYYSKRQLDLDNVDSKIIILCILTDNDDEKELNAVIEILDKAKEKTYVALSDYSDWMHAYLAEHGHCPISWGGDIEVIYNINAYEICASIKEEFKEGK